MIPHFTFCRAWYSSKRFNKMAGRGKPKKLDAEALWEYALRALGQRAHSTGELRQKLSRRAVSAAEVDATLAKLREYELTNDQKFSEAFAAARLQNQGFGRLRVLRDLSSRRVGRTIAERAVEKTFGEVDELTLIRRFLERRYRGKDLVEFLKEEKHLASVYRRLRTAGFTANGSLSVLKGYSHEAQDWSDREDE